MIITMLILRDPPDDNDDFLDFLADLIVDDLLDPKPPYESSDLPEEESEG
jgi:hypothetical protein